MQIAEPVERLGEELFQLGDRGLFEAGAVIDQFSPEFAAIAELPRERVVEHQRPEVGQVLAEKNRQHAGVERIVLLGADRQRFAIAGRLFGIDWIDHEVLVFHQRCDHRSARLLDGDRDGPTAKPLAQFGGPGVQFLGRVTDLAAGSQFADEHMHRVLAIGPVEPHDGRKVAHRSRGEWGGWRRRFAGPAGNVRLLLLCHASFLYSETWGNACRASLGLSKTL